MAVGKVRGEIVRSQYCHHAMRLVAQRGFSLQRRIQLALAGAFGIGADGDFHLADDCLDLCARFPQRLAGFAGNQFGEFLLFPAHFVDEAAHALDPLG